MSRQSNNFNQHLMEMDEQIEVRPDLEDDYKEIMANVQAQSIGAEYLEELKDELDLDPETYNVMK